MIVIVDTREQRPLVFSNVSTVRATLATGDYSVQGHEDVVAVERKSLSDLHACVGRERARFERELERLRAIPYRAIVVEASMEEILSTHGSLLNANAILGSMVAWAVDGVPVVPCSTPTIAAAWVERFLSKAVKRIAA